MIKPKKITHDWGPLIKAKAKQGRVKAAAVLPTELEDDLTKVRSLAPLPPSDDLIYEYLRGVYRQWHKVEGSPKSMEAIKSYHKAHRLRIEKNFIRFIIEQTAADHVTDKMKNKYRVTLDLASEEGVKPVGVIAFIKNHGGLNGCIELFRKKYGRPQKKPRKKKP